MRELTVNEQEAIDGGWNWCGVGDEFMKGGAVCGLLGAACDDWCPPLGVALGEAGQEMGEVGAACWLIGKVSSWF